MRIGSMDDTYWRQRMQYLSAQSTGTGTSVVTDTTSTTDATTATDTTATGRRHRPAPPEWAASTQSSESDDTTAVQQMMAEGNWRRQRLFGDEETSGTTDGWQMLGMNGTGTTVESEDGTAQQDMFDIFGQEGGFMHMPPPPPPMEGMSASMFGSEATGTEEGQVSDTGWAGISGNNLGWTAWNAEEEDFASIAMSLVEKMMAAWETSAANTTGTSDATEDAENVEGVSVTTAITTEDAYASALRDSLSELFTRQQERLDAFSQLLLTQVDLWRAGLSETESTSEESTSTETDGSETISDVSEV